MFEVLSKHMSGEGDDLGKVGLIPYFSNNSYSLRYFNIHPKWEKLFDSLPLNSVPSDNDNHADPFLSKLLCDAYNDNCIITKDTLNSKNLSIDHVIPKHILKNICGGKYNNKNFRNSIANLIPLSKKANSLKSAWFYPLNEKPPEAFLRNMALVKGKAEIIISKYKEVQELERRDLMKKATLENNGRYVPLYGFIPFDLRGNNNFEHMDIVENILPTN